jgi:hypothetical protein
VDVAFGLDPDQGLEERDELDVVELGRRVGYVAAWTPSRGDAVAFDRCIGWHRATGIPTGIAAVPASEQPPEFFAEHARRTWDATEGTFTLGVGSGRMPHPAEGMRRYLSALRRLVPADMRIHLAALGPRMVLLAVDLADGVDLNWCTAEQVERSREAVRVAAQAAGREPPPLAEYIRTSVDADPHAARHALAAAVARYALAPGPYRRHFERLGFADELARAEATGDWDERMLSAVGAWGAPAAVRQQLGRLATGLDLAIVRVVAARRGDPRSVRAVLEECAPAPVTGDGPGDR